MGASVSAGRPGEPVTCAWCGTVAPDGLPLGWTTSVEGRVQKAYCTACSREHLRSIEGKLDADFW